MKKIFFNITVFLQLSTLFCDLETLLFKAQNKQACRAYLTKSSSTKNKSLILFLDGSNPSDAKKNHIYMSQFLAPLNMHIVTLEKPGNNNDHFDEKIFYQYDYLEKRLETHIHFLQQNHIERWNQKLFVIGVSEGGKLAAKLAKLLKNKLQSIVLVSCGNGLSFAKESYYQLSQHTKYTHREIVQILQTLKMQPTSSTLFFAGKSYCWWSNLLNYSPLNDLLTVQAPILLIHGVNDTLIPVASADALDKTFREKNKKNLHYIREKNAGHAITKGMQKNILNWLKQYDS